LLLILTTGARGLSTAVCASVTARLIHAGYQDIYLYTEDFRLAALALYLKLGYPPFIHAPDMLDRWRRLRSPWLDVDAG
jgi:mycothiol synthase